MHGRLQVPSPVREREFSAAFYRWPKFEADWGSGLALTHWDGSLLRCVGKVA